jgi:hypothetical protein
MRIYRAAAAFAAALSMSACASIVEGTKQQIFVTTTPETGATCTASNALGKWQLVTPATVVVAKSDSVLKILCSKPGWQDGTFYAAGEMSTANLVGNMMPYVGLLNAAVDGSTGAALKYPSSYTITLKPLASASGSIGPTPAQASSVLPSSTTPTASTQ